MAVLFFPFLFFFLFCHLKAGSCERALLCLVFSMWKVSSCSDASQGHRSEHPRRVCFCLFLLLTGVFSTISDFGRMQSEMRASQRILGHLHWQPSANLSVGKEGRNIQEDKCVAGKGETCDCEHRPPGPVLSFPSPQIRHISGRKHVPVSGFRELMTALMEWENKFFFVPRSNLSCCP